MGHSILTVDDSKTVRMVVKRVFNTYDCVIHEATNGEEGLVAAAAQRPDIILLDITMPVMDGVTMLAKLKEDSTLKDIPVIMLTAEHGQENVQNIIALGIRDYIVKPFKDEQLYTKVQKILPLAPKEAAAPVTVTADATPVVTTAAEFGHAAVPDSVKQLVKLISRRDATLSDYTQVILQDAALTARLLRATNSQAAIAEGRQATAVEAALQRVGLTFMLLIAISDPLIRAVVQNFHALVDTDLTVLSPDERDVSSLKPTHVVGEVAFTGKTSGIVHVRLPASSVAGLGERLQNSAAGKAASSATGDDVVGVLCKKILGTFESNLCDAGLGCTMGAPKIESVSDPRLLETERWVSDRYGFRAEGLDLFVDLSVNCAVEYS